MTDEHSQDWREREDLLRRHREISETLRRTMLALLTFSLFCWLTAVGSPDHFLVVSSEPTVKIPFIDVSLSFPAFLIVAPFLLTVFAIYLHVFSQERLKLEASLGSGQGGRAATLFNFDAPAAGFLTAFIFYWLVPLTLGAIAWKASGSEWPRPMIVVTVIVTAALSLVQNSRSAHSLFPLQAGLTYAGLVIGIIGALLVAPTWVIKRPLDLHRTDLSGHWLIGVDLRAADLRWANLSQAKLRWAKLSDADLRWANLSEADLREADLSGADLRLANMSEANLSGAILLEADLRGVDLSAAADLTQGQLNGAIGDDKTKIPRNLKRPEIQLDR